MARKRQAEERDEKQKEITLIFKPQVYEDKAGSSPREHKNQRGKKADEQMSTACLSNVVTAVERVAFCEIHCPGAAWQRNRQNSIYTLPCSYHSPLFPSILSPILFALLCRPPSPIGRQVFLPTGFACLDSFSHSLACKGSAYRATSAPVFFYLPRILSHIVLAPCVSESSPLFRGLVTPVPTLVLLLPSHPSHPPLSLLPAIHA